MDTADMAVGMAGTAAVTAAGTVDMAVAMAGMADTADMAVDAAATTTDER